MENKHFHFVGLDLWLLAASNMLKASILVAQKSAIPAGKATNLCCFKPARFG
jgi:hypothetical protein